MEIIKGKQVKYQQLFDINNDNYSRRCFTYAEQLAEELEKLIILLNEDPMKIIFSNIHKLSHKLDTDNITGVMYNYSISLLKEFWIYGYIVKEVVKQTTSKEVINNITTHIDLK